MRHLNRITLRPLHAVGNDSTSGSSADDSGSGGGNAAPAAPGEAGMPPMPKRGFFKIADPNAEVYSKAGDQFDPAKKPDRWKPEFIWNTNWQDQLKLQEDLERKRREYLEQQKTGGGAKAGTAGIVSLSRLSTLDDMSVDLTEQLLKAKEKDKEGRRRRQRQQEEEDRRRAAGGGGAGPAPAAASQPRRQRRPAAGVSSPSYEFKDLPTRVESRRFARATRISSKGISVDSVGTLPPEEAARRAAEAEASRLKYEQLKLDFLGWTLAAGALGSATTYFLYTPDISASYAVGALGGLLYLRLLGRSVDSLGGGGGGGIGQPRLLIPVILVLLFNRWNQVYADDYGLTLQLIPMLLGFFTYKIAVLGRQGLQELSSFSVVKDKDQEEAGGAAPDEDDGGAMTLDRIFVKRVTREW